MIYLFDNAAITISKLDDPILFLQGIICGQPIQVNRCFLDAVFSNADTKDRIKFAGGMDRVSLLSNLLGCEVEEIDN